MKHDVTKSENLKKHHVTQGKKGRKKGDGEPTDNKHDESMESMASNDKKRDVNQPTDDSDKSMMLIKEKRENMM